jgi:hypothetical protein
VTLREAAVVDSGAWVLPEPEELPELALVVEGGAEATVGLVVARGPTSEVR